MTKITNTHNSSLIRNFHMLIKKKY